MRYATRTLYVLLASLTLAPCTPAEAAGRLTLSWRVNSGNQSGFAIERREAGGAFAEIATIGPGHSGYIDIALTEGRTYCYRVRAFNAAGYSPYTNEACAVSAQDAQAEAIQTFVARYYTGVLGHGPDPQGLQAWTGFLASNCTLGGFQQLAGSFFDSTEFRTTRSMTLPDLTRTLYIAYLGREPQLDELATWTDVIRQVRLAIAFDGFVPSREFQSSLPDPGNRTAVASLVTRLYNELLGRAPDQAGLDAWVDFVASTRRFDALAAGFLTSTEFESRPQTIRDYVTKLYRTFLGRDPDAAGLDGWESILTTALLWIANGGFVPSQEFQGLAASICR